MTQEDTDVMSENGVFVRTGVIMLTLLALNGLLYAVLPPAQPKPDTELGEQTRRSAESTGRLAAFYNFDSDNTLFTPDGWYTPEPPDLLDASIYQFMADTEAVIRLPVGCAPPWSLEIAVMDNVAYLERLPITATLNGQALALDEVRGFRRWFQRTEITTGTAGDWELRLSVPKLIRPADFFATDEDRELGAALDWVMVTSETC